MRMDGPVRVGKWNGTRQSFTWCRLGLREFVWIEALAWTDKGGFLGKWSAVAGAVGPVHAPRSDVVALALEDFAPSGRLDVSVDEGHDGHLAVAEGVLSGVAAGPLVCPTTQVDVQRLKKVGEVIGSWNEVRVAAGEESEGLGRKLERGCYLGGDVGRFGQAVVVVAVVSVVGPVGSSELGDVIWAKRAVKDLDVLGIGAVEPWPVCPGAHVGVCAEAIAGGDVFAGEILVEDVFVVAQIEHHRGRDVPHIAQRLGSFCGLLCLSENWEKDRGEDSDNCDDDQKFDKGERSFHDGFGRMMRPTETILGAC